MATFPVNTIFEIKYLYRVNGQVCMNVLHYAPGAGAPPNVDIPQCTQGLVDNAATDGNGTFIGEAKKLQSAQCTYFEVTAQMVFPTRWAVKRKVISIVGLNPEVVPNQNTAITFEKLGDLGNRHNVGSLHLGGISWTSFASGLLAAGVPATLDGLKAFLTLPVTDGVTPTQYDPCILNKRPIPGSDPVKYEIYGYSLVTSVHLQPTARVMRRRTVQVGI